jgi:hypothetical protein
LSVETLASLFPKAPYSYSYSEEQFYLRKINNWTTGSSSAVIPNTVPSLDLHLGTDKEIYMPFDVIFIEGLLFNSLYKEPEI